MKIAGALPDGVLPHGGFRANEQSFGRPLITGTTEPRRRGGPQESKPCGGERNIAFRLERRVCLVRVRMWSH